MVNFAKDFEIFNNENLGSVRTAIDQDGNIWFVAIDVCDVLGISNNRMALTRLDTDEKAEVSLTDVSANGTKQSRKFSIINESGMYTLVLSSRKPQAKEFKRWLSHEVIPSIRQHGGYIYGQELMQSQDLIDINKKVSELADQIQYLKLRRSTLRKQAEHLRNHKKNLHKKIDNLTNEKEKLQKDMNSLNEYADLYEDMFEKAQNDFITAINENKELKERLEKLKIPKTELTKEILPEICESPKYYVMANGIILYDNPHTKQDRDGSSVAREGFLSDDYEFER